MLVPSGRELTSPASLQHAQVLRDGRLRERQLGEDVRAAALGLRGEQPDDPHACRVSQGARDRRDASRRPP